jgi:hypothetical protein
VADEFAGRKTNCKKCGAAIVVPTPSLAVPDQPERDFNLAACPRKPHRSGSHAMLRAGIVVGVTVLIMASIATMLYFRDADSSSSADAASAEKSGNNAAVIEPSAVIPRPELSFHDSKTPTGWVVTVFQHQAKVGDITITAEVCCLDRHLGRIFTRGKRFRGIGQANADNIKVVFQIANNNPRTQPVYTTWRDKYNSATLRDDLGNTYAQLRPSLGQLPEIGVESERLLNGEVVSDTVHFEKPVPAAKDLYLAVPLSNIGHDGSLTFHVPFVPVREEH